MDGAGGGGAGGARHVTRDGRASFGGSPQLAEMTVQEAALRDLWLETTCLTCGHRCTTAARRYVARWAGLRLWELQPADALRRAGLRRPRRAVQDVGAAAGKRVRVDTRRQPNGALHQLATSAALAHPVSRVWAGYWQL